MPKIVAPKEEEEEIDHIDWVNLSPDDKEAFFGWLDEFFARYLQVTVTPRPTGEAVKHVPLGGRTPSPITRPVSSPLRTNPIANQFFSPQYQRPPVRRHRHDP